MYPSNGPYSYNLIPKGLACPALDGWRQDRRRSSTTHLGNNIGYFFINFIAKTILDINSTYFCAIREVDGKGWDKTKHRQSSTRPHQTQILQFNSPDALGQKN